MGSKASTNWVVALSLVCSCSELQLPAQVLERRAQIIMDFGTVKLSTIASDSLLQRHLAYLGQRSVTPKLCEHQRNPALTQSLSGNLFSFVQSARSVRTPKLLCASA